MLGLYLDTIIIGYTFCSILNELTLQQKLRFCMKTNFRENKQNNNIRKIRKHKHTYHSRELNPGPLASQSGVLPLGHRDT